MRSAKCLKPPLHQCNLLFSSLTRSTSPLRKKCTTFLTITEARARISLYNVSNEGHFGPSASHVPDPYRQSQNEAHYCGTIKPIIILNGPTHWNERLTSIGISEFNLLTTSMLMLCDVTWEGETRPTHAHCLIATGSPVVESFTFRVYGVLYS